MRGALWRRALWAAMLVGGCAEDQVGGSGTSGSGGSSDDGVSTTAPSVSVGSTSASTTSAGGAGGPGAGGSAGDEGLCDWLSDPDNCYRDLAREVGAACGGLGPDAGADGAFMTRELLDICVLHTQNGASYAGGQVVFDPPLDPLAGVASASQTMRFLRDDASLCGLAEVAAADDFSLEIVAADGTAGGRYQQRRDLGALDVTCPDGAALSLEDTGPCEGYDQLRPHADLEVLTEGSTVPTGVRLRILFPPPQGDLPAAQPYIVEYFDCAIPAPPSSCEDGAKDGSETDIDCGGTLCPDRCGIGQLCETTADCEAGLSCDEPNGFRVCG